MRTYRGTRRPTLLNPNQGVVTVEERAGSTRFTIPLRHPCKAGQNCHSPEGFDWGYEGAGPLELARWLLADCLGRKWAQRPEVYTPFMHEVISTLPAVEWELPEAQVAMWAMSWGIEHQALDLVPVAEAIHHRTHHLAS